MFSLYVKPKVSHKLRPEVAIPHVPTERELIDKAFSRGSKAAGRARTARTGAPREVRLRNADTARVQAVAAVIKSDMTKIVKNFPSYEQLPEFYQRLLDIQIDKNRYKKSLGALKWCSDQVEKLERESLKKIQAGDRNSSKEFLGRVASIVKRISSELDSLIEIKRILLDFPTVEDLPTLVIAGYPNSGKSTFMKNLTGSKVKIAVYPFTTQKILIGHAKLRYQRYQIIDSPGLLDRPMEKRNRIEQQAILAINELADVILFLVDPTTELEPQLNLLEEIRKEFKSNIFVAINKTDIAEREKVNELKQKLKNPMEISALREEDCKGTFKKIFGEMKNSLREFLIH